MTKGLMDRALHQEMALERVREKAKLTEEELFELRIFEIFHLLYPLKFFQDSSATTNYRMFWNYLVYVELNEINVNDPTMLLLVL